MSGITPFWLRVALWIEAHPGHTVMEIGDGVPYPEPGKRIADARKHGWIIEHDNGDPPRYRATRPGEVGGLSLRRGPSQRPNAAPLRADQSADLSRPSLAPPEREDAEPEEVQRVMSSLGIRGEMAERFMGRCFDAGA